MENRESNINNDKEILIVEDSSTQAMQLKYILEQSGFHVTVAVDGEEAIEVLNRFKPKIVISDIVMPKLDGFQLCKKIRENDNYCDIPVILVTSLSDPNEIIKGLECGADNFIVKPYEMSDLIHRVEYLLADEQIHKSERSTIGVEVFFGGEKHYITSNRLQILNLLLSTYETAVQQNQKLINTRNELNVLNEQLELRVQKRTKSLNEEIMEHKKTEESLRISELKYRHLIEALQEGIWTIDQEGYTDYVNPAMAEMLGYSVDDMKSIHFFAFMDEQNIEIARQYLERSKKGIKEMNDFEFITKEGKKIFATLTTSPIFDENGIYKGALSGVINITERKRMGEALRKNEERLKLALEATSDGIWDWNIAVNDFYLSNRFYIMLGYEPNEFQVTFENMKSLIHPDDVDGVLDSVKLNAKNEKIFYDLIFRLKSKYQGWRWVSNRFKIVKETGKGYPLRIVGTITDITESKISEEELKRINRALKVLSGCNKILIKTKEEKLLLQNICDKILEIGQYDLVWVGFANDDLQKSVTPIAWSGNDDGYLKNINISWSDTEMGRGPTGTAIRTGKPSVLPYLSEDQNFNPWFEQSQKKGYKSTIALPLTDDNHSFGSLNIYSNDINAFDKNEIELLSELANDLAYGINVIKTQEKHDQLQGQLLQSQKMEAVGKLAGGIAHDFNNILTVILVSAELLPPYLKDESDTDRLVQQIILSTKKAASLTHQLLAFSRKQMIQPMILDLNLVVTEAQKMYYRLIGEDINLILNRDPLLKNIKADPGQIDQIIMNLVVNAKDAMPDGGKLTITTHNIELTQTDISQHLDGSPGQYVCLEISDTGTGINREIIPKIFDPFFTTKELGRGTGLGLSVVYGIVKENSGWIELETELGKGTIFKIYFPGIDLATDKAKTEEIIVNQGHGEKIFVVEDDLNIREIVYTILTNNGYSIIQSENIKKALILFNNNNGNFDMVFMDVVLPDGSGIELYKQLLLINPNLKVLFTSGYADEKARWSIMQEKRYNFIQKPYKVNDLLKEVKNVISAKSLFVE
jgi:PAS domain S-box-containing protein